MYARLEDDVKQDERAVKMSSRGESPFKLHKESSKEREGWVRQGVHVVFKEMIYNLISKIQDKSYYKKPLLIGGDPKKKNQRWKCVYHEDKRYMTENYRALNFLLDQMVQVGHLKE